MLIDFCLPIKNEELVLEANVLKILDYLNKGVKNYDFRIIILNNGSNQETLKISEELEKKDKKIKVENILESGKGLAIKKYFLKSEADVLVFMDVDLATSLENIPDLINPIITEEFSIVIGSRLLKNSQTDRSLFRELSSRLYGVYSKIILQHPFKDLQCGFKAFKKEAAREVFSSVKDSTWFFDTEALIIAKNKGYKIKEIPIDWRSNRYFNRKSKTPLTNGWYFFKKVLEFKKRLSQEKRRPSL